MQADKRTPKTSRSSSRDPGAFLPQGLSSCAELRLLQGQVTLRRRRRHMLLEADLGRTCHGTPEGTGPAAPSPPTWASAGRRSPRCSGRQPAPLSRRPRCAHPALDVDAKCLQAPCRRETGKRGTARTPTAPTRAPCEAREGQVPVCLQNLVRAGPSGHPSRVKRGAQGHSPAQQAPRVCSPLRTDSAARPTSGAWGAARPPSSPALWGRRRPGSTGPTLLPPAPRAPPPNCPLVASPASPTAEALT